MTAHDPAWPPWAVIDRPHSSNPMRFFFDYEKSELVSIFDPAYRATQLYRSVYQKCLDDFQLMTDLPKVLRASLSSEWNISVPEVHRRFDSIDETKRYLIHLSDGELGDCLHTRTKPGHDLYLVPNRLRTSLYLLSDGATWFNAASDRRGNRQPGTDCAAGELVIRLETLTRRSHRGRGIQYRFDGNGGTAPQL